MDCKDVQTIGLNAEQIVQKLKTKILKPKVMKQKFMCKKDRQEQRLLNVLKFERKVLKPVGQNVGQNGVRCYLCLKNYSSKETVDKHLVKFSLVNFMDIFFISVVIRSSPP